MSESVKSGPDCIHNTRTPPTIRKPSHVYRYAECYALGLGRNGFDNEIGVEIALHPYRYTDGYNAVWYPKASAKRRNSKA